jgi:ATP/maltotriose-dependent transcriptional regulator MalT
MQRGHVGYACLEIGAYDDAERALRDALEQGTRLGLYGVVATAKHNLGRALQMRGELDEAARVEQQALDAFEAQGDRRLACAARYYLGNIYAERGELDAAEREIRAALAVAHQPMQGPVHASLARVLIIANRNAEGLVEARAAHAALDRYGAVEEGEAMIRLVLVEALQANGDVDSARRFIAKARDRLLERAEKIVDPEWRRCFLERVPEHARTIALAAQLGS